MDPVLEYADMYIKSPSNKLMSPIILQDSTLYDLGINRFSNLTIEFKFVKVQFPMSGESEAYNFPKDAQTEIISLQGRAEMPQKEFKELLKQRFGSKI